MTTAPTRPDFAIIGAMKCGTSTLQAQLAAQPGIFMTDPKEPNYFSDDAVFARGPDWYAGLYESAAPGDLTGEASTHYTKLPTHPKTLERMAAVLPAPKLIYLMRDPVERAISHYMHGWSIEEMGDDPVAAFAAHPELIDYGRYAMQLAPFVARYGREAILLLRLEQMQADPQGTLDRVGEFLGRAGLVWNHDLGARNVSSQRLRKLPLHRLLVANPLARSLRRALVPGALRQKIRASRQMTERPVLPEGLRQQLAGAFAADQAELAALFPGDPALTPRAAA